MSLKISLDEFLSLSTPKKFDVLFIKGNFIDTRTEEKQHIVLYGIDQFFVELYYDTRVNKIIKMKSFKMEENLN